MKLLTLLVGKVISSYPPGAEDIYFISSAQALLDIIKEKQARLDTTESCRRILAMVLLKMITLRITAADYWEPELFGALIIKKGILKHRSIKPAKSATRTS